MLLDLSSVNDYSIHTRHVCVCLCVIYFFACVCLCLCMTMASFYFTFQIQNQSSEGKSHVPVGKQLNLGQWLMLNWSLIKVAVIRVSRKSV